MSGAGAKRGRIIVAAVAAGIALAATAFAVRECSPGDAEPVTPEGATSGEVVASGSVGAPVGDGARIRGAVRIEVTAVDAGGAGEGSGGGDEAGAAADVGEAPPSAQAAPTLATPASCTVIAWREGQAIGAPARCDADGRYELALDAPPASLAVEVLVPGYLRVVLLGEPRPGEVLELPTVALGPASHLAGQVVDGRGQPLAGVALSARPRPDLGEPEPWRLRTGDDGRFRFDTVPPGPIAVEATLGGFALSAVDVVAPEENVTIVLDGLHELEGDVLGPPEALARSRVWIEGSSIWPPLQVPVDASGHFVIPGIPDGIYGLVAEAPGGEGEQEYASIPLENVTPAMTVSLALIEAARVPVKVQAPDGRPVTGAHVTVGGSSIGLLQKVAETGPSGQVAAGPLVPGPYLVRADADGYLPSETVAVDVQGGAAIPELTLTLLRPARILGSVVDEIGEVVADARITVESEVLYSPGEALVRARTASALLAGGTLGVTTGMVPPVPLFDDDLGGEWTEGATASDREGRFFLDLLLPGTYRLRAVHAGHAASALVAVTLGPGETRADVLLVLQTGHALTGRVRDGNGRPLSDVRVELDDGQVLVTDERGLFDAGLHRGKRTLVFRAPGMIPRAVEVDVDRRDLDLEQVLLPAEGGFEGRVTDGNGQPIGGARVALYPEDGLSASVVTYSDARGLFDLEGLSPGGAAIEVDHPDFAAAGQKLKVAPRREAGLRAIVLERGWELEVVVREAGSGDPVAGATIAIDGRQVTTDAAGEALLVHLSAAQVAATIDAPGWVRERASVERPEGGRASLVVELEEGAAIEGTVQDERGEAVSGARIVIRHRRSGEVLAETTSGSGGAWRVDRLGEGDVIVEAAPPADLAEILAPTSAPSDVLRGRVTRGVDLRFDRL